MNEKAEATAAIARAQTELDEALTRLRALPAVDADQLSYAAHALSNYLMVVMTIGQLLRKARTKDDGEFNERLDSLRHATVLMKQMVQQLMTQRADMSPRLIFLPVDLVSFGRAAADEAERMAEDKNLALQRDFPVAPVMVWTDRVALGAIVDNFVSNALKYSAPGGTIRIRVDRDGEEGIIAITDSGPGIAEGTTFDVFDRGKILSSRPTAGEPSTGYGMAIVRDLAGSLGARVWFQNEPLRGATFFVGIPLFDSSRHIAGSA